MEGDTTRDRAKRMHLPVSARQSGGGAAAMRDQSRAAMHRSNGLARELVLVKPHLVGDYRGGVDWI